MKFNVIIMFILLAILLMSGCSNGSDPATFLKGFQSVEDLYKTSRAVQEQQVATAISIHAIAKVAVTRPLTQAEVKEIRALIEKLKKSEKIRKTADAELEAIWNTQIIGGNLANAKHKVKDILVQTKLALQLMQTAKEIFMK